MKKTVKVFKPLSTEQTKQVMGGDPGELPRKFW